MEQRPGEWQKKGHSAARLLLAAVGCFFALSNGRVNGQPVTTQQSYKIHLPSGRLIFRPSRKKEIERLSNQAAHDAEAADGKARRALKELQRCCQEYLNSSSSENEQACLASLLELTMAINSLERPPLRKRIDVLESPFVFFKQMHSPVGRGESPASNLQRAPGQRDLSQVDPVPGSFWRRPAAISNENLYAGFGRAVLPDYGKLLDYSAPKESYGRNPGFEVSDGSRVYKLKFGELHSEPFATRIFDALGYHVDVTDYAPMLKVRYDRRIFLEFNSRKSLRTDFTMLGFIPIYWFELQERYDPFDFFAGAVLRDGTRWSGQELRAHLLRIVETRKQSVAADFVPEVESQLEYLITVPTNVQPRPEHIKTLGPWDLNQLDHQNRRELRALGLLAAWVGWFDARSDNLRLRVSRENGQLLHYIADLGGAMGQTSGFLYSRGQRPNDFPWTFTAPPLSQGAHRMARPLQIVGYKPIQYASPFAAMTLDDARWMARLIAQLTEQQIVAALRGAGYSAPDVRLYTEKLLSRRDHMLLDLGLDGEFPFLRRGLELQ